MLLNGVYELPTVRSVVSRCSNCFRNAGSLSAEHVPYCSTPFCFLETKSHINTILRLCPYYKGVWKGCQPILLPSSPHSPCAPCCFWKPSSLQIFVSKSIRSGRSSASTVMRGSSRTPLPCAKMMISDRHRQQTKPHLCLVGRRGRVV